MNYNILSNKKLVKGMPIVTQLFDMFISVSDPQTPKMRLVDKIVANLTCLMWHLAQEYNGQLNLKNSPGAN